MQKRKVGLKSLIAALRGLVVHRKESDLNRKLFHKEKEKCAKQKFSKKSSFCELTKKFKESGKK